LRGDSGTYHVGMPTLQKVARGGGDDYSPNFLMSAESYDLDYLFDSHYDNDMVWYLNSSGEGSEMVILMQQKLLNMYFIQFI